MNISDRISLFLHETDEKGLTRTLRNIQRISATRIIHEKKEYLDFSSNDYLGLSLDRRLAEESIKWTNKYGTGSSASRLLSGSLYQYGVLEEEIAFWKKSESALIFGSGYLANIGAISSVCDRNSVIFADKFNHNSLLNACLLSKAKLYRYQHISLRHLQKLISENPGDEKIIVSDTVFSMDGDIPDIAGLISVSDNSHSVLYLDEAHATGIFGDKGEGFSGQFKYENLISMGTFSKALGSYGAYMACSREIRKFLINKCPTFIYSTALPPSVFGAIHASVKLVQTQEFSEKRKSLLLKAGQLCSEIKKLGFNTGNSKSPIIPIIIGDSKKTLRISQVLLNEGIMIPAIRPPTVPEGSARLRISLNSEHTERDIARLLEALTKTKATLESCQN